MSGGKVAGVVAIVIGLVFLVGGAGAFVGAIPVSVPKGQENLRGFYASVSPVLMLLIGLALLWWGQRRLRRP